MECIKTAEDNGLLLQNVTNFFFSEKAGIFLLAR
jgi:hypothetical protein